MKRPALLVCLAACVACAAPPRARPALPVASAARPAPPATASPFGLAPARAAPWRLAYVRTCRGSIGEPLVAPDGSAFAFCDARFEAAHGGYRGPARVGLLSLLDSGLALADGDAEGVALTRPDPDAPAIAASPGGVAESAALSADESRVVTVEDRPGDPGARRAVVVRTLPALSVALRAEFEGGVGRDAVAFVADGRPIVLASHPCRTVKTGPSSTRTTCEGRGVFEARADGLVSLGEPFSAVSDMAVARSGTRAALVRPDGTREVVSLPGGRRIAALPALGEPASAEDVCPHPLALDADGERVAYADASGVHVARIGDGAAVSVYDDPLRLACHAGVTFAPGGDLLAWDQNEVRVFRQGAAARPALDAGARLTGVRFDPPPGFRAAVIRGDELTLTSFEESSEAVPPDLVARWRRDEARTGRRRRVRRPAVDVWVYAEDPAELDAADLDGWSGQALARYAEGATILRAWRDESSRSIELARFRRDGCDPVDAYVRLTETRGVLYRVVMEIEPGASAADVPFAEVFEGPFGAVGPRRASVEPPGLPPGPC